MNNRYLCIAILAFAINAVSSCNFLPEVEEVRLSATTLNIVVGSSSTLTATVLPEAAEYEAIMWKSSDPSVASVSGGTVTGLKVGKVSITATAEGVKSLPCEVNVMAIHVTGVSLNKNTLELTEGETFTLTPTVSPSNATDRSVKWSTSDYSVASVSSNGLVTAKVPGTATITVMSNDGGKTASCQVTVNPKVISVTGVTLSQSTLSLTEGETSQLQATVSPSNATNMEVKWSSSNTSVATVDSNGKVTAKSAGTATITARTTDQGKTATCSVTVKSKVISVTGVSLSQSTLSLKEGDSWQLQVIVTPSNATNKGVSWMSGNTSVATVSSSGVVTAKAVGSTTITCTTNDGNYKVKCSVFVRARIIQIKELRMSHDINLLVGQSMQQEVLISPSNATDKTLIWYTDNKTIATVDNNGFVTGISVGTTTLTCMSKDGNAKTSCPVTVSAPPSSVASISINNNQLTLFEGTTSQLIATVSPSNASNYSLSWSSSNPTVAEVSSSGNVWAHESGSTVIEVSAGGKKARCCVFVYRSSDKVSPLTFEIIESGTLRLTKACRAEGMGFSNEYPDVTIEYQVNHSGVLTNGSLSGESAISVSKGDLVQFWGNNESFSNYITQSSNYSCCHWSFGGTAKFSIRGNIMSIIQKNNYSSRKEITNKAAFAYLFSMSKVVSAKYLFMPAESMTEACYMGMFDNCHYLTDMPNLQASNMAPRCYFRMFEACESLKRTSDLPSLSLAQLCYGLMFASCSSLEVAPLLPAEILSDRCYQQMFSNCSSLRYIKALFLSTPGAAYTRMWVQNTNNSGTFIKSIKASWELNGIDGIPEGWAISSE